MKLLFDQNISHRVVKKVIATFPNALSIKEVGLYEADDRTIWDFAKSNNFIIVTQDDDFNNFVNVWGFPPKVIWIKTGNLSNATLVSILITRKNEIQQFIDNQEVGLLEIYQFQILKNE